VGSAGHQTRSQRRHQHLIRGAGPWRTLGVARLICVRQGAPVAESLEHVRSTLLSFQPEPVFLYLLRSPGIDSQPGGPVRKPYLSYWPARLHGLAKSIPRNRFLGSINFCKYGLRPTISPAGPFHWVYTQVKYGARSLKFIWAPFVQLYSLA
jgi:hypothetical protein